MKLLLSFPTQEDAESIMSALIKLQQGSQAVHFGLLASRLAWATVYGPLRDEAPQENFCHPPNTSGDTERIHCARCGKAVSSPVPKPTIVRAWVECPECIETTATVTALLEGTKPQTIPYHAPNCFECLQVDVPLRHIEGKLICAECARYKYPGL